MTDVLVVSVTVLLVTLFFATVPPRILKSLWLRKISPYTSLPFPDLQPLLPMKAQGLFGAPAVSFNNRVRAYDKLPQPLPSGLFKERFLWFTILNTVDVRHLALMESLEKLPYLAKASSYAGEEAVFFGSGPKAVRNHARLVKAFSDSRFPSMIHSAVLVESCARLRKRCIASQTENLGVSADEQMLSISVETLMEIITGSKLYEIDQEVSAALIQYSQLGSHRWLGLPFGAAIVSVATYSLRSRVKKYLSTLVEDRLAKGLSSSPNDLLDLLILSQDDPEDAIIEGVSKKQWLVEQLQGLLVAGVMPLTHSLCWSLTLLALNPKAQEKVADEVEDVLYASGDGLEERPPHFDELPKLKNLDSFVREVLRLFPAVPFIDRVAPTRLDSVDLPPGTTFRLDLMALHRSGDAYKEVNQFDPDRWSDSRSLKNTDYFLPFGAGSRSCVGKQLSMHIIKMFIGSLLRNHKILPYDRKQKIPDAFLVNGFLKCFPGFDIQVLDRYAEG